MKFPRGFKAEAERLSCELRAQLGLSSNSILRANDLIAHLGIILVEPIHIPGMSAEILNNLNKGSDQWSAVTLHDKFGQPIIINNPVHAPTRRESDLMHEVAHILRKHKPAKIGFSFGSASLVLRSYDEGQEDEAKFLGACLQIPRKGLAWAIGRQMDNSLIGEHFGASEALVRFRRNLTGVDIQFSRYRRKFDYVTVN
jgi:Zn-dependent peptidase ImmA (M78 family)